MKRVYFLLLFQLVLPLGFAERNLPIHSIKLPPGFQISIFAENVPNARSLAQGEKGTIFVGSRTTGNVYALRDQDQDGKADKVYIIASKLWMPNGVAFRKGSLYVAEINRILRFDEIESSLENPPKPVTVNESFPKDTHHGWKFIAFGPDDKLYVPVGAPCNVCEKSDERYASITRMNPDGTGVEVFASGVRNTVGFHWHPTTKEFWFTDNGRDWAGDDLPPDELNRAPKKGLHFGFPYCHGGFFPDPEFGKKHSCAEFVPPAFKLGPHVAALGMRFYTGKQFPESYQNQIFIAEHGSWNRTNPLGYRIMLVRLKSEKEAESYEVFAEGWLGKESSWGRPVDLLVLPDGSMLVSDDHAGAIYRIAYQKP